MTWDELIARLQDIPEDRREEQAVFASRNDGDNWIIDEMELMVPEVDGDEENELPGPWACNVGNEDMTSTYALIP